MWSSSSRLDALLICCSDLSNADRDVLWKERGKSDSQYFTACLSPVEHMEHLYQKAAYYWGHLSVLGKTAAHRDVPGFENAQHQTYLQDLCPHRLWGDTHIFTLFITDLRTNWQIESLLCPWSPGNLADTSYHCCAWGGQWCQSESQVTLQLTWISSAGEPSPRASATNFLGSQNSGSSQEAPLQGQLIELEAALSMRAHPYGRQAHHSTCCKVQDASAISHCDYTWVMPMSSLRAVAVQQH